jgi:hypothetical protein
MSFSALHTWNTSAADALSQLEVAHSAVGGTAAGRRTNTLQLNYAFVLLLSAHFQAFCRDLHTQMTRALSATLAPAIGDVLRVNLTFSRQLDVRNAQPGSLGADFNRFGLAFWPAVEGADRRNRQRREKLNQLNEWRNAIAHHDIASRGANLTPREVTLDACKDWRSALNGLVSGSLWGSSRLWCLRIVAHSLRGKSTSFVSQSIPTTPIRGLSSRFPKSRSRHWPPEPAVRACANDPQRSEHQQQLALVL